MWTSSLDGVGRRADCRAANDHEGERMAHYFALLDSAPEGGFGVIFPDCPGCTSAGDTLDDAVASAAEALWDWLEVRAEFGDPEPKSRSLADLRADPEVARALASGAVVAAIPATARRGRTMRVQITLDEGVLAAVDEAARRSGDTRSGFLARASLDAIARRS
jgi:predicted RNase H-like HicB family nuclease